MLLTKSNVKIRKGESQGYRTFGIHFAPAKLSGKNVCPNASKGCAAACLNVSGQGYYQRVQDARIKKTKYFLEKREEFMTNLKKDIETSIRRAKKNGMVPCFRLNLTSDLAWESIKVGGKTFMEHFPTVQFYDYCKTPKRMLNFLSGKLPKNYHLTFSRSESNETHCDIVMACGGNVAMVFRNTLPETYKGKKVINGDETDLRFLDPKGVIVGLVAKGVGKKDESGFIIDLI